MASATVPALCCAPGLLGWAVSAVSLWNPESSSVGSLGLLAGAMISVMFIEVGRPVPCERRHPLAGILVSTVETGSRQLVFITLCFQLGMPCEQLFPAAVTVTSPLCRPVP